jgi:hypothetical protein
MKLERVSKTDELSDLACFRQCWWWCELQWHWIVDRIESAIFPGIVAAAFGNDDEGSGTTRLIEGQHVQPLAPGSLKPPLLLRFSLLSKLAGPLDVTHPACRSSLKPPCVRKPARIPTRAQLSSSSMTWTNGNTCTSVFSPMGDSSPPVHVAHLRHSRSEVRVVDASMPHYNSPYYL